MKAGDLTTPTLLADVAVLDHNLATMSAERPGPALRPHVKAFKATALAARLAAVGHTGFCCATIREVEGMAAAGLGSDLLLANDHFLEFSADLLICVTQFFDRFAINVMLTRG